MEELKKDQLYNLENCPICKSTSKLIDIVKTINPNSNETLNLRECKYCEHWWIDPMPKQNYLIELYRKCSEFITNKDCKETCTLPNEDIKKYANRFLYNIKNTKKLNYLEIGVGSGKLFNFLKKKFNLIYGIDPAKWKPLDKNIVEDIKYVPDNIKFDVIILQDVMEHLENPLEMMIKIKKISNKNAIIGMCFPNKDVLIAKIQKGRWSMIRPIGHLHFFSSKSIEKMFENSGWKLLKKYSYWAAPTGFYYIKNFDFHSKSIFRLIGRIIRDLIIKQLLLGKDQWYVIGTS